MKKTAIAILLSLLLALSGCTEKPESVSDAGEPSGNVVPVSDMFSDRDSDASFDESKSAVITLTGSGASSSSNAVRIDGSTVTVLDEGTYIVEGTLSDGQLIVDAEKTDKVQLVLRGAEITCGTSAAVYVKQADKVFITLASGTENVLRNGGAYESIDDNNIDAVLFSKEDLTLNGEGSLTVEAPVGHGVVSKDDLAVTGGSYTVLAASQGLSGKDSVRICGGTFDVTSGKDGIRSENDEDDSLGFVYIAGGGFTVSAEGDGISASSTLRIDGGSFTVTAGGGSANGSRDRSDGWGRFPGRPGGGGGPGSEGGPGSAGASTQPASDDSTSMKGLKAGTVLTVTGGEFRIDSADDAVHSNGSITVTDGSFEIATGDDGFHADESLTVTGGVIRITESYEGLEALNLHVSGGDISVKAEDDGFNAAGGTDESGFGGRDDGRFGGGGRGPGGRNPGGFGGGGNSNGTIVISGGTIYIEASGDGLDANGSLSITGGAVTVCGPNWGDTSTLDYDTTGTITGGTFIGTGAGSMAQTFSDSEQGVIFLNAGSQKAGTAVTLTDSDGKVLLTAEPALDFSVVTLSSPELVKGETYTLTVGTQSEKLKAS